MRRPRQCQRGRVVAPCAGCPLSQERQGPGRVVGGEPAPHPTRRRPERPCGVVEADSCLPVDRRSDPGAAEADGGRALGGCRRSFGSHADRVKVHGPSGRRHRRGSAVTRVLVVGPQPLVYLPASHLRMSQAMLRPLPERAPAPALDDVPVAVGGKFFFVGDHKLHVRGVSYGPFGVAGHGFPFPVEEVVDTDLRLMVEMGANTLRTFTVPPRWLLDRVAEHGLRVLVTIPWAEHVCFLDRKDLIAEIRGTVRAAAEDLREHPALLGLLVGNEIPPDIVRWYGPDRIREFLGSLVDEIKQRAPGTLVSYANFPSTRSEE